MSVWRLIFQEIQHRKLNFVLGFLSNAVAVGCLVGAMTLLDADEIRTDEIMAKNEKEVDEAGAALNNEMRKITKGLGFNILILPQNQDLNELHTEGVSSTTMPEELVDTLANSKIVTINHLLPMVSAKVKWKEKDDQTIIIVGTRGEVPIMHRATKKKGKKPLMDRVTAGTLVVGFQLHKQHKLKVGDQVTLLNRKFEIKECYDERGTSDDSTVWMNLKEAQEMLGRQNLVNAILALECNCATEDRVAEIRNEIAAILPGTQVVERGPPALARAEARNKAAKAAKDAMAQEKAHREQIRTQREDFASVLVPLVIVGSAVWIGFLAIGNVRQRSSEIGILRALGVRTPKILTLFLGKALVIGLLGGIVGYGCGFGIGILWGDLPATAETSTQLFAPLLLVAAIVMAPGLSGIASWLPAMLAAGQDPAVVLQDG